MSFAIHNTEISVVPGSVIDQEVDAIVNAADTMMRGGGGIDGAIHRKAGKEMVRELELLVPHRANTGTVVVTGGHDLKQKYVFHTPGPRWRDGNHGEAGQLASCYRSSLEAADERGLTSIGFCSISTGVYGYPIEQAAPLAVQTVVDYLTEHPETALTRVIFAMYSADEFQHFEKALASASKTS